MYSERFLFFSIVFIYFLILTVANDPGILPRSKFSKQLRWDKNSTVYIKNTFLNKNLFRMKFCKTCRLWRPERTNHCSLCNYCILVFDHHCPWMKTCVGFRNYKVFSTSIGFVCWYFFVYFNSKSILNFKKITWIKSLFFLKFIKKIKHYEFIFFISWCFIFFSGAFFSGLLTWFHFYLNFRGYTASELFKITGGPFWIKNANDIVFIRFKITKKPNVVKKKNFRKYQLILN